MKISIIIPCYNMEKSIERTLVSIKKQGFNKQIEVVVVNDGSTDNSLKIINSFAARNDDMSIKVLTIQNGGLANARNVGINACSGDYFINLDSDDFLEEGIIEKIIEKHKCVDFDVCFYGMTDFDEESRLITFTYLDRFKYYNDCVNGKEAFIDKAQRKIWICQGSACYRKKIVFDYSLFNIKGLNQGEDFYFIMSFLSVSKVITCVHDIGVNISYRKDSMMHAVYNDSYLSIFELITRLLITLNNREDFNEKEKMQEVLKGEFENQRLAVAKKIIVSFPDASSRHLKATIKQKIPPMMKKSTKCLSFKKKLESFIFNHFFFAYKIIVRARS